MPASKILFNVPLKFDGRYVRDENATQGQLVHAAVLDVAGTGKFDEARDQVLLSRPDPKAPIVAANFDSIAQAADLAKLSSTGSGVLNSQDLEKAGITFCFDRDHDGQIDVNRPAVARGFKKFMNGIGEGVVTYNGDEKISAADKAAVGQQYFKDYVASLDTAKATYQEEFQFNPQSYEAYSKSVDQARVRGGILAAVGLGTFAAAYASHTTNAAFAIGGVCGLVVGVGGLMVAVMMAKLRPDLPVQY